MPLARGRVNVAFGRNSPFLTFLSLLVLVDVSHHHNRLTFVTHDRAVWYASSLQEDGVILVVFNRWVKEVIYPVVDVNFIICCIHYGSEVLIVARRFLLSRRQVHG